MCKFKTDGEATPAPGYEYAALLEQSAKLDYINDMENELE